MAQLGSGQDSGYPGTIDTRQTFQNSPLAAPDSASRLDAEVVNDALAAIVNMQQALGANPQGVFGSVAARLQQFLPGGGASVSLIPFAANTTWRVPGTVHKLGSAALLFQLYDAADPANMLEAGSVTVDPTTYDMTATFSGLQAGLFVLSLGIPAYIAPFTAVSTLDIPGIVHQLGTPDLFFQCYDDAGVRQAFLPGSVTVHPSTFDVHVAFGGPTSGTIILAHPGPVYAVDFVNQTNVTVPGSVHQLNTRALLVQCYDASIPREAFMPGGVTVDAASLTVTAYFGVPTSGRLLLGRAGSVSGLDFHIVDSGLIDQTAVRLFSSGGNLYLQCGDGGHVYMRNRIGTIVSMLTGTGRLGLGIEPTHELQLSTGDAVKATGTTWANPSDEGMKKDIRPFEDGLTMLLALEPIWFRFNGRGGVPASREEHIGLVAQAVEPVAPYMVRTERGRLDPEAPETDVRLLDTHALSFAMINAFKTVVGRLEAVETELAALRARLPFPPEESLT